MNLKKLIFLSVLFFTSLSFAEKRYVTDLLKITLRSGPDISYRVIGHVFSGEEVIVSEVEHKWTRIKDPSGRDGWVLSRFLTSDEPKKDILMRLKDQHEKLKQKAKDISKENESLKKDNKQLSTALENESNSLKKVKMNFQTLENNCKKYNDLVKQYKEVKNKLSIQDNELITIKQEKEILERFYFFWGFGLSLGVLLLGFLAGKLLIRKKSNRLI